jgi:Protein of unknown function (DUF2786)
LYQLPYRKFPSTQQAEHIIKSIYVMIRVKIRYDTPNANACLLRFDESIDFEALIRKVAAKLGVLPKDDDESETTNISQFFQLTLEGDAVVQESSEIEHGDYLVLRRIREDGTTLASHDETESTATTPYTTLSASKFSATSVKNEGVSDDTSSDDDADGNSVQDDTEEILKRRAAQEKKKQLNAITLSSDEDEDDIEDDADEGSVEDGSDAWDEAWEDEDDSDNDDAEAKPASTGRKRSRAPPESPLQVIMDEKDVPAAPGKPAEMDEDDRDALDEVSMLVDLAGRNKADRAVKDRIIKLLNTGFHDQSNEHEAKNAMKLAQRLMRKHNLCQALLLKERDARNKQGPESDEILRGGLVKLQIQNRKTGKAAQYARWISQLSVAVANNFGVKCYKEVRRGKRCTQVFYGIYTNAQLAGYAFRIATERIAQMTAEYKPIRNWYNSHISPKSSRLSYSLGIVNGISEEVQKNIRLEKERLQRKLERAREAVSTGAVYEESDEESDEDCSDAKLSDNEAENDGPSFVFPTTASKTIDNRTSGDRDATSVASVPIVDNNLVSLTQTSLPKAGSNHLQQLEQEEQAALVLVSHGEKVAEEVLEAHGIKLSRGRKRQSIQFDRYSFRQGVEDSKEIDINQRAIRDETKVKREKKRRK